MKNKAANNLIPHFIHEQFLFGKTDGQFEAITLFMDIYGFTNLTQTFMQHGKAGAEELAKIINAIFEPIILAIYERGAFITGFAGDALTAVFPTPNQQTTLAACDTALIIRQIFSTYGKYQTPFGEFELAVKQGLAAGNVEWGILGPAAHKTYFFRGNAIHECALAEQQANASDIVLAASIQALLSASQVVLSRNGRYVHLLHLTVPAPIAKIQPSTIPHVDEICHQFFPKLLWQHSGKGEFRQVGVVFLSFQTDINQATLNEFITQAIQTCNQFGGHFMEVDFGDKGGLILVCFGAPKAYENDKARALSFTLALTKKLDELNLTWHAGITFGLVYAGMIGIPLRNKYAVLGSVVNLAARLMVKADQQQILVSAPMTEQAGFSFSHTGDFIYKGFAQPLPTYQLLGQEMNGQQQPLLRDTPLVGRETERQQLFDFLAPLLSRQPVGTAVIYGEPGIGKSALIADLQTDFNHTTTWILCQTDQILRQAFNPFIATLKRQFNQAASATGAENKAAFVRQWQHLNQNLQAIKAPLSLREELVRTQSMLGALLDLHWQDSLYEQLDGELRYENTITAVKTWLFAESCLRPVVLVIEDGHWLDKASRDLLTSLHQEMDSYALCLIITSRYLDNGSRPAFNEPSLILDLKTLPAASLRQQAQNILGAPLSDAFFNLLQEKSQANPFFAQQLIYYFQETHALVRDKNNAWTTKKNQLFTPTNINIILIARIDRLTQQVKEVVQTAAVLGNEFDVPVLSLMLHANIIQEIQHAETDQIWIAVNEWKYIFKHILLRDAAYEMQMRQQLRQLHLQAAVAYEQLHQSDLSPHYAALAYHYRQADVPETERQYARLAGEQASHKGNQRDAITYLSRALELSPESEKYELLLLREDAYHLLGDRENQAKDLIALTRSILLAPKQTPTDRTQPLAPTSPAHLKKQVEIILHQARYRSAISDYSAAAIAAQRAIHLAQEGGHFLEEVRGHYWWGEALERQARYSEARHQLNLGLEKLQTMTYPDTKARLLKELGWLAFREGNPLEATERLEEALSLVQQTGHRREEMMVLKALGGAANASGNYLLARNWQQKGLTIAQEIGHHQEEGSLLNNLGNTNRFLGNLETAVSLHQRGSAIMKKAGWRMGEAISHINLGLVLPHLGAYQTALNHAQYGLKLAQEIHARMIEGAAWYILGNIATELGNWLEAEAAYQKSADLYQSLSLAHYTIEAKAGLLRAYLGQQKHDKLIEPLADILAYLDNGGSVSSVEEPLRIYLTCHQALNALNSPQAPRLLQQAHALLETQANRLPDEETRRIFIEAIPFHQAIMNDWQTLRPML